ncbi:MAG: hypothetical protein ACWA7E_06060 [Pseudomonas asiatica]
MRYNTGNPVGPDGSNSPFDLFDNSGVLDLLLNGPLGEYLSRLGVPLKSWLGIMQQVTDYLIAQGYESVFLVYGADVVVNRQTQLVQKDGELYRVKYAADLPLTLTGSWGTDAVKLQAIGDAALRQQLSSEVDGALGAGMIGGGFRAVKTLADLRGLSKNSPSKFAIVLGDGFNEGYYLDPADGSSAENKMGTVIVGTDGGRWKSINKAPKIPVTGEAIKVTGTGYDLLYPDGNLLKNSTFDIWHDTGPAPMTTSLAQNTNAIVCAQWRMETVGTGTTVNSIRRITSPVGGLRFNGVFGASTGYVYVRQNLLGVQSFSGKVLTATVEFEVDGACQLDFYARMRLNAANDEANRPLVVLTPAISISAGRQTVSVVMICPDVTSLQGLENQQQSLEFAFRFIATNVTRDIKVYGASISPGRVAMAAGSQDPVRDRSDAEVQYESGTQAFVGWPTTSGQRRITANFKAEKYRVPTVTISDAAGNVNAVSTYDAAGARTDGVTGYIMSATEKGVEITFASSTIAGIRFNYAANCYF